MLPIQEIMSDQERSDLALKVERIETLLHERQKQADANGLIIRTIALGMLIQVMTTVYFAGVKTQKLDNLSEAVASISKEIHHVSTK